MAVPGLRNTLPPVGRVCRRGCRRRFICLGLAARPGKGLLVDLGTNREIILTGLAEGLGGINRCQPRPLKAKGIAWGDAGGAGAITGVKTTGDEWHLETLGGGCPP